MPIRAGEEPEREARERARQRRRQLSTVPPQPTPSPAVTAIPTVSPTPPPPPTPTPPTAAERVQEVVAGGPYEAGNIISTRGEGTPDERIRIFLPQNYEVGDTKGLFYPGEEGASQFTVLSKERSRAEGAEGWVYDIRHADIFQPYEPGPDSQEKFPKWVEWKNGIRAIGEWPAGETGPTLPEPFAPFVGRTEDVTDAEWIEYLMHENLLALRKHVETVSPEAIESLGEAQGLASSEALMHSPTLDPTHALALAHNRIAREHPDDYTTFISSPEGANQLWQAASSLMFSVPPPSYNLWEDPKDFILATEEAFIPDIPLLKDSLIRATDLLLDPYYLALFAVLPPAGLAAKAQMATTLAMGMATGEEAAEQVGAPEIAGALVGGLGSGAMLGFTRAGLRAAGRAAMRKPVFGEPATELLVRSGEIDAGGGQLLFHGRTSPESAQRVLSRGLRGEGDVFLTTEPDLAAQFGGRRAPVAGETARPTVLAVTVPEGVELGGREAIRVVKAADAGRLRVLGELSTEQAALTGEAFQSQAGPYYRAARGLAGAEAGPNLAFMENMVRALVERPEAQDWLRSVAQGMTHIPGGRRMVEVVNRMAITTDAWLKAAFGWQGLKTVDDAARQITMSGFRGRRFGRLGAFNTPMRENNLGQVWLPDKVGSKTGSWVAGGDVVESVVKETRGIPLRKAAAGIPVEQSYLSRLTPIQRDWLNELYRAKESYVSIAERETGQHIARREIVWGRQVVDLPGKKVNVRSTSKAKPSFLFERQFESQEQAISEYGIHYKPSLLNQAESSIEALQRISRDAILTKSLQKQKLVRFGKRKHAKEAYVADLDPVTGKGYIPTEQFNEIMAIVGPGTTNPAVVVPQRVNSIFRMMLTGSLDTGWGAIQLMTLLASPAGAEKWVEAMARGFWNMAIEPKQVYRFINTNKAARRYGLYGGNLGLETEFMEAMRQGIPLGPLRQIPGVEAAASIGTAPVRAFISRLQAGFESSLLYGRVFAFDAMADVAAGVVPMAAWRRPGRRLERGLVRAAGGPAPLTGAALHDEMYRLARFTDTLIGQPKLAGVLSARQQQIESAFVWFATRYTRSFLGTMSYAMGKGFTPAQARVIMAKFLMGGMATMSGLVAAQGVAMGKSQDEILNDIKTAIDPRQGKKFMSLQIGKDWYGLGGVYRSGFAAIGGLINKKNWDTLTWEEAMYDNPITRIWRMRAAPTTSTFMDFMDGEDFLGYEVDRNDFITDPQNMVGYGLDKFAPITVDALLQDGDWTRKTPRFLAEFFGLRTSPETAWEALEPVMNRVAQDNFAVPWEGLEHNTPAQDLVRNHPDVVAVTEGRTAPLGRRRREEEEWKSYYEGRDAIRYAFAIKKNDLDKMVIAGRMDGAAYREQYGDAQSAEFHQLLGYREGLGFQFDDEEAPVGTVDAALKAYYDIDLDDYRDKATGAPDWEAFFADRDAALAQVPEEFDSLVEQWVGRHQTPLRHDFREKFEELIEPTGYLRTREMVAVGLGINLNDLESQVVQWFRERNRRAAPIDVAKTVDRILNGILEERYGEDAPSMTQMRSAMREANPALDLELYRQGFVTTVRSLEAVALARRMQRESPNAGYFLPPLAQDVERRLKLSAP